VILVVLLAIAVVVLFLFVIIWLISKEDIGRHTRAIARFCVALVRT
jgi:NADH:ubiquinone oxidoreductase subunit 6 (subunit J)